MITADQERARLLRERLSDAGLAKAAATVAEPPWRSHGVLLQVIFFVLTAVGLAAFLWFLSELDVPKPGLFAGIAAIALAEYLIRNRRWFGTGVEAALWLGGLYAMISELPSRGTAESLLVLGAAPAVAWIRVRNPLFGALSLVFLALYFEKKLDLGVVVALGIAAIAVLALMRTWRRPSTEWLWIAVVLVLPVTGYTQADEAWRSGTVLLFAVYGLPTLILGLRKRHHSLLLSGGVAIAIAMVELGITFTLLRIEAKLALAGAALLGGSWLLSRALHDRTTGLVVTPSKLTSLDDAIEIAGTINIPQPDIAPGAPKPIGDGGSFGGAGSTGSY